MQNQTQKKGVSKISIFDYLASNEPGKCRALLVEKYGYPEPKNYPECISMLKSIYRKDEATGLADMASIHPDLQMMSEYLKNSEKLNACGCPFGADGELNCEGCGKKGHCGFDGVKNDKQKLIELEKRRSETHDLSEIKKEKVQHLPADGQKTTDDYVKALIPTIAILFTFTIITYLITRKS